MFTKSQVQKHTGSPNGITNIFLELFLRAKISSKNRRPEYLLTLTWVKNSDSTI